MARSQKTGPERICLRLRFASFFGFGEGLESETGCSERVPKTKRGTATAMIRKAKVAVDPRQPYHSATMLAVGKETLPANPATRVIMVIDFFASIPRVRVTKAKQGS